jgi:ribose 1,5-bisphosphokinase PhnN
MTFELEYNARSLPPADVARSFVPPEPHFVRLLSRNHTLVVGPRGSGKTTLLKMLTVRALKNWKHPQADDYIRKITFNAAFVAADIAWGRQIDSIEKLNFDPRRKEAAFVLHTLRALVYSMREAMELGRRETSNSLAHLRVALAPDQEERFVKIAAAELKVSPALSSMLGIELALESRLNSITEGTSNNHYLVDSFPSKISLLISAFNGLTGQDDRRWALLFDELEIAPTPIKSFLLSGIRSFDERVVVKLAMAPYMEDVGFDLRPTAPQPLHDYHTVQLTYPNKEDATQFSSTLFLNAFHRVGIESASLRNLFEGNDSVGFGRRFKAKKGFVLPLQFKSLAAKDESFRRYVEERGIFSPQYKLTENNIAQDVRKVLPIVTARDYYLRFFDAGRVTANRSRKSHTLYTGYPSIVEITEGNPRAILTLVGPLAQEHLQLIERTNRAEPIPISLQTRAVRRIELLLTSLLQVIPIDISGFDRAKGLLDFVDQIGRAFEDRLLKRPFTTDYVGTFVVDENVTAPVINAVGKALNAGALVHVPYEETGPDILLRSFVGQRFRLSYALAPRYRLLLTLGDRISLSKLLLEMRGVDVSDPQASFFGLE